jgi:putative tryptophan/tyrosine transport system substrate-binding protein
MTCVKLTPCYEHLLSFINFCCSYVVFPRHIRLPFVGFLTTRIGNDAGRSLTRFKEATKARSTALAVTLNPLANSNQKRVVDLAAKNRRPAIYARKEFVEAGGLMSYGPSFATDGRDAARLVDKILKGAKLADLPVEQPTKFELMINLRTAKALGLTILPVVLMRAEKVIK